MSEKPVEMIHGKMVRMVKAIGAIAKNKKSGKAAGDYNYRSVEEVMNAVHEQLVAEGVYLPPAGIEIHPSSTEKCVLANFKFTFIAEDGSRVVAEAIGQGRSSSGQAATIAQQYAYKTAMCQTLSIPTKEIRNLDAGSHAGADAEPSPADKFLAEKKERGRDRAVSAEHDAKRARVNELKRAFANEWMRRKAIDERTLTEAERDECAAACEAECGAPITSLSMEDLANWISYYQDAKPVTKES